MMFTHSELEEVELMKFYCNDDILSAFANILKWFPQQPRQAG